MDLFKSTHHWQTGVLDLLTKLYSIVDYALRNEERHAQTWLYHSGFTWAGNPLDNEEFPGLSLYRWHLQDAKWGSAAWDAMESEEEERAEFLAYRDRVVTGTQQLLAHHPDTMYLLCLHVEKLIESKADKFGMSVSDSFIKDSTYGLYNVTQEAQRLLYQIHPNLRRSEEDWEMSYERSFS